MTEQKYYELIETNIHEIVQRAVHKFGWSIDDGDIGAIRNRYDLMNLMPDNPNGWLMVQYCKKVNVQEAVECIQLYADDLLQIETEKLHEV